MHCLRNLAAVACIAAIGSAHAATVHQGNVVLAPVAVNDFELAPAEVPSTWSQQGIRATQVDAGRGRYVWLDSGGGNGERSWHGTGPGGGDDGWTRLTLDSGENFDAISFLGGSLWITQPQTLYFELADDGAVVLDGTLPATFQGTWISFSGGDFDEVRLRASQGDVTSLTSCPSGGPVGGTAVPGCNFVFVDDIRVGPPTPIPLPGSAWLAGAGLVALGLASRRRAGRS